jgi:Tfp pilus assembly protein PilE
MVELMQPGSLAVAVIIAVLAAYALTSLGTSIERSAKELAKAAEIIYSLKFECHREGWYSVSCQTVFRDEAGLGRVG